ncbi:MAG: prephenate dehydrogenase [Gemmataceae bacterium]|nr:prephenate dehydrogenase [Gemmataceae bacterium]
MQLELLTIVGVGLIGGSIGLAAKRRGVARRVRGLGRQQASLDRALEIGAIDEAHLDPQAALTGADLVVVCTPVDHIADQVVHFARHCGPATLLTDAGSTKAAIVETVEARLPATGPQFVGSHPLAGSEKRGPDFAHAQLFEHRLTVVTPTPRTPAAAVDRIAGFWSALGSRVKVMSPADHDRALALTSHLPHLLAAALAGTLPADVRELTATGFRDTTRIAAGDPRLWTAIFTQNRMPLLDALGRVESRLREFRQALEAGDPAAIDRLLAQAKEVRDALGN